METGETGKMIWKMGKRADSALSQVYQRRGTISRTLACSGSQTDIGSARMKKALPNKGAVITNGQVPIKMGVCLFRKRQTPCVRAKGFSNE